MYGGPQLSRQNQKPHGKNKIPHGKTENLTAKTKTSLQKQNTSRQNQRPHGKTKQWKTSRQNQILHSKNQIPHGKSKYPRQNQSYFVFAVKYLVLPWSFWFCRDVFCFCREVFGFAVMFLFLPWGFCFCRDSCGPRDQGHFFLAKKILVRTQTLVGKREKSPVGLCLFVCLFFLVGRILWKRYSCTNSWTEVKEENDGGGTEMLLSLAPTTLLSRW